MSVCELAWVFVVVSSGNILFQQVSGFIFVYQFLLSPIMFLYFIPVCKLLVFHWIFFWQPIFDIFYIAGEFLVLFFQFILLTFFLNPFFLFTEGMWYLLHVLWVLLGGFHFSIYMHLIIMPYQMINPQPMFLRMLVKFHHLLTNLWHLVLPIFRR